MFYPVLSACQWHVSCDRKLILVQDGDDGTDAGSAVSRDEETDTVTQRM